MGKTGDSTRANTPNETLAAAFLRSLINELPDGVFFKDPNGTFVFANRAIAEQMGAERAEDLIGKSDYDFYAEEVADRFRADEARVIESGTKLLDHAEPKTIRGTLRSLTVTKVPVFGADGTCLGIAGISSDIMDLRTAETALLRERNLLRSLIEILPLSVYAKDIRGRKTLANPYEARVMGLSSEKEAIGKTDYDIYPKDIAERFERDDRLVIDSGTPLLDREEYYYRPDGEKRWLLTSKVPLRDVSGAIFGLVGVGLDITDRKQSEAALAFERSLLKALMDNVPDHVYFKDTESRFIRMSKAQARRFGLQDPVEAIGKTDSDFFTDGHAQEAYEDEQSIIRTGLPVLGKEERETWPDQPDSWVLTDKMPLLDDHGNTIGTFGISRDITELKRADEKIKFMATHDPLTGLPNRFLLNDRLRMGIALSRRNQTQLAVMLIDLDDFKTVNDRFGHDAGDQLLCSVAEGISKCLRANDTLARMGGDEFVAVLSGIKSPEDPTVVATRILAALDEPHHVCDRELSVSASIGISIYPDDCDDTESLLRNADMAMYGTKAASKRGFRYYSQASPGGSGAGMISERELATGLEEEQFELYYQPIQDAQTEGIRLAEVLLRWNHPNRGLLDAGSFVPVAEKAGFIIPLSEWVLRKACEKKRSWTEAGLPSVALAINISPKHFQADSLVEFTERILTENGVTPGELFFEITETSAIEQVEKSRTKMLALKELGVRIIIDDFGTGYASLRWLKVMPTYAIKIDRFFVQNIQGDANNIALLRAIIYMAHSLGLKVIAGGVETEAQAQVLNSLGIGRAPSPRCDSLQGYYIGHPAPAERLMEMLITTRK